MFPKWKHKYTLCVQSVANSQTDWVCVCSLSLFWLYILLHFPPVLYDITYSCIKDVKYTVHTFIFLLNFQVLFLHCIKVLCITSVPAPTNQFWIIHRTKMCHIIDPWPYKASLDLSYVQIWFNTHLILRFFLYLLENMTKSDSKQLESFN